MNHVAPSDSMKLFGTEQAEPLSCTLKAGDLTALFDNGALRRIRFCGAEVLRGIAYLSRDKNWGTYAPAIANLQVKQGRDGFTITYDARFADADQSFQAQARIEAKSDGTLSFTMTATPDADFTTNRTGFVILHPLNGVVGKPVDVVHTDGTSEKRHFPALISPGQPIFEIRSLTHRVVPGVTATVRMEGNKFEMEDHRNWMDASYKTYVCSLLDPWPYTLPKGEAFTQSITLTITGKPGKPGKSAAKPASAATSVTLGKPGGRMPAIGTAIAMADAQSALGHADLIAAAKPAYLVCQIDGRQPAQAEAAATYREIKARTGLPITVEIILPARAPAAVELAEIAANLKSGGLAPDTVIITQMHDLKSYQPGAIRPWGPTYEDMAAAARKTFPGLKIGGGMLSFFTELNRKPPPQGLFDFITHSTCPIVHAADDLSVMETLESLPWIIKSTRAMIGNAPYHLGPSGLGCRDNPYGATNFANPGNNRICLTDSDPRQAGQFGAAWCLGLVAALARGRLDAVALGSATGPRGVMGGNAQSVAPAYHILAGLAPHSGSRMIASVASAPAAIATLAHQTRSGPVIWVANLTCRPQKLTFTGLDSPVMQHVIDADSFVATGSADFLASAGQRLNRLRDLTLQPYAVTRLAQS